MSIRGGRNTEARLIFRCRSSEACRQGRHIAFESAPFAHMIAQYTMKAAARGRRGEWDAERRGRQVSYFPAYRQQQNTSL